MLIWINIIISYNFINSIHQSGRYPSVLSHGIVVVLIDFCEPMTFLAYLQCHGFFCGRHVLEVLTCAFHMHIPHVHSSCAFHTNPFLMTLLFRFEYIRMVWSSCCSFWAWPPRCEDLLELNLTQLSLMLLWLCFTGASLVLHWYLPSPQPSLIYLSLRCLSSTNSLMDMMSSLRNI